MIDTADLNHFKEEWDRLKAKKAAEDAAWERDKATAIKDFKDPADVPATSIKVAEVKPVEVAVNPSAAPEAAHGAARLQEQLDHLPFKQRYAVAREDGVENFQWRGRDYSSDTKEEKAAKEDAAAKRAGDAPTRDKTAVIANDQTIKGMTGDHQNEIETRRLAKAHPAKESQSTATSPTIDFQSDTAARKQTSQEAVSATPTATVKLSPSEPDTNTVHTQKLQTLLAATAPGSASAHNDAHRASPQPATNHQGQQGINWTKLLYAVGKVESGGEVNSNNAISHAGAKGWMQVTGKTAMDPGYGAPSIFTVARDFSPP